MTNRERALAVLHYQPYDRLPLVHFGFWKSPDGTLAKWAAEGHITAEEARDWGDGNAVDRAIAGRLGFDFNWSPSFSPNVGLQPNFEPQVIKEFPDGSRHVRNAVGAILLEKPGAGSIPPHVGHTLTDRTSWEEHYRWRFQFNEERVAKANVRIGDQVARFDRGGIDLLRSADRQIPCGLFCGSLYGRVRDMMGIEGACYLLADDEELFTEIIDTIADLSYRVVKFTLDSGARFDFGHFWEDICFRSGPLVSPRVFAEKVGPHYKRITDLLRAHGTDIVSLDCDGKIDALVPIWLENGVNTMFPIEVGTWGASIAPWREQYGRELRGVGGMDKRVFARDRAAIDKEIERLKPLVALGGYIPCPDHRIAPDAKWDLVRYYTDRMRQEFG